MAVQLGMAVQQSMQIRTTTYKYIGINNCIHMATIIVYIIPLSSGGIGCFSYIRHCFLQFTEFSAFIGIHTDNMKVGYMHALCMRSQ